MGIEPIGFVVCCKSDLSAGFHDISDESLFELTLASMNFRHVLQVMI